MSLGPRKSSVFGTRSFRAPTVLASTVPVRDALFRAVFGVKIRGGPLPERRPENRSINGKPANPNRGLRQSTELRSRRYPPSRPTPRFSRKTLFGREKLERIPHRAPLPPPVGKYSYARPCSGGKHSSPTSFYAKHCSGGQRCDAKPRCPHRAVFGVRI